METRRIKNHRHLPSENLTLTGTLGVCNFMVRIVLGIFLLISFFFMVGVGNVESATLRKPPNNLGLVGYWSFNDATSTSATDFSGRGNIGTLINMDHPGTATSGWGSGKFGTGLIFDGLGDYVTMNGVANDVTETSFTFSVWIKSGWTGAFDTVLAINTAGLGNQTQIFIDNTLTVRVYDGTQDATELSSSGSVVDGKWHHVVYSRSGATGTLYVDGVSQGTHNSSDTFTGTDLWSLGQEFDAGPTASDFFLGSMDEVRIYNRPLSQADVTVLYNTGLIQVNSSSAQRNIVTNGLIGYWTLDGGKMTVNTAYDSTASANTLSLLNGPQKTVGKTGQSINMDAVDDELFCTDANCGGATGGKLDMGTRDWTVMAWVKPENGGTNCNIRGTVVGKIGDDEIGWYLGIGGQFICAEIRGASNISSTLDGSTVPLNEWSHIAVVFDRDGNMTRYLNGVQTGTQDNISANNGSSVDHPHNFCIGARDGAGGCLERLYDGSVDEVRVYERVLTTSEIKQVYNAGVGAKVSNQNVISGSSLNSGLIGLWSFNGTDLTDQVYDRSGNGHNGYFSGGATSTAKTTGKIGQAINFDGVNDTVLIAHSSLLDLDMNESATFSFWVNKRSASANAGPIYKRTSGSPGYNIDILTTGAVSFAIGDLFSNNNKISNDTSTTMNLNEWYHVVVTYDGSISSTGIKIYFNGVLQSMTNAFDGYGGGSSSNGFDFSLGARESGTSRLLDGKMDEVRFYNRVLTTSEIKQLYLMGR